MVPMPKLKPNRIQLWHRYARVTRGARTTCRGSRARGLGGCAASRRGGALGEVRRQAEHRETAAHVEVADILERERPARAIPVPDAVVEAEDGASQQARVGLGNDALLHAAREEGRPGE